MAISGMGMMLKSMGIDPDEIKQNVEAFMETMKAAINEVKQNQLRLESKQDLILTNQQSMNLLVGNLIEHFNGYTTATGSTVLLKDDEGKDLGIAITDEKFSDEVLKAAQQHEKTEVKNG